jgi:hypothetical protein
MVVFLLRSGLGIVAGFTNWLRSLLAALRSLLDALFGRRPRDSQDRVADGEVLPSTLPPKPFSSFSDPFQDGSARQRTPEELIRYSFAALHSWAWEYGQGRTPEETPIEFGRRVGEEFAALEAEAQRLASLYARLAYARGPLPQGTLTTLQQFWTKLGAMAEQPLSA